MAQGFTKGVPIDTDGTLAANSDQLVPSQKAAKTYIDAGDAARQPINTNLTTIAGLSPANDDIIQRKAGAWTNRTMAQLYADLQALVKNEVIFNLDFSPDTTAAINDATTYYVPGAQGVTLTTTAANTYGVYIENDCTLYAASFWHVSTAIASSENGTLFIRKNNTSNDNISTSVPTAGASAAIQRFTGLSINYSAGDYIYPGYTTPTYATNPTNLRIMVTLWFKLR